MSPRVFVLLHPATRRCIFSSLALCVISLSGCDKKKQPQKKPATSVAQKKAKATPPEKIAKAPVKKDNTPPARQNLEISLAEGRFATKLFSLVAKGANPQENFVMSPMSVYLALGMTRLGAQAQTATALNQTLALSADANAPSIAASLGQAQRTWTQSRPGSELAIANQLFAAETFKIKPEFVKLCQSQLGAGIQNLDFAEDHNGARQTINRWVQAQTKDRIKDLLKPGDVSANTPLVLANAIWFKGQWAHQFKPALTKRRAFHLSRKKVAKVPMMAMTHNFAFFEVKSQGYRALDLPYADGRLAMTIILPNAKQSLTDLESNIDLPALSQGLSKAMPRRVSLRLPKFTIKPKLSISLRTALSAMGAKTIFGTPSPNFGAMASDAKALAVKDVIHKAMIIVDEKGAEAAAATAVTMYRSAAVPTQLDFHANRPFLFMIRDKKDGSILFAGRVTHPKT